MGTGSHLCPLCKGRQHREIFSPVPGHKALLALRIQGADSLALSHREGSEERPILVLRAPHPPLSGAQPPQGNGSPAQDRSFPNQHQQFPTSRLPTGTSSPAPNLPLGGRLLQCPTSDLSPRRAPLSLSQHLQCPLPPSAPLLPLKADQHDHHRATTSALAPPSAREDPESRCRSSQGSL